MPDSEQIADQIWSRLDARLGDFSASGQVSSAVHYGENEPVYTKPDEIETGGKEYDRSTHPKLFMVIDQLADQSELRRLSVRKLAVALDEFEVGKSWCAVAKKYWQETYEHDN